MSFVASFIGSFVGILPSDAAKSTKLATKDAPLKAVE
jgi:hypothetical protein